MHHLKENYPHFFSLAIRTNPFDAAASPNAMIMYNIVLFYPMAT